MNLWLNRLSAPVPAGLSDPAGLARFELESAGVGAVLHEDPSLGDSYRIDLREDGLFLLTGGQSGLLYAAYRLISSRLCGEQLSLPLSDMPKYALRMVDCWDNMDGSVERGYSGKSLFFMNGRVLYNAERIRVLGRLMASSGLNVLCVNNVNVHDPAQLLLEDYLPDLAELAGLFRPFGVRLMVSIDSNSKSNKSSGKSFPSALRI